MEDSTQAHPGASMNKDPSPYRAVLGCAGLAALVIAFFILFPFRATFGLLGDAIMWLAGVSMLYTTAFVGTAFFLLITGLCARRKLSGLAAVPRPLNRAMRAMTVLGGLGVFIALLTAAFEPARPSSESAQRAVDMLPHYEKALATVNSLDDYHLNAMNRWGPPRALAGTISEDQLELWSMSIVGDHVLARRTGQSANSCAKMVEGMADRYTMVVNRQDGTPGACASAWDNTIEVTISLPESFGRNKEPISDVADPLLASPVLE